MEINTSYVADKTPSRGTRRKITPVLRQMWQDSKRIFKFFWSKKKQCLVHFCIFCIVVLPLIAAPLLIRTIPYERKHCGPGGDFSLDLKYDPWSIHHMFQITIGFGNLTFSQAKLIDVIWDVVVGRGGQSILAILTFKVFTKALSRLLEDTHTSVSYGMFEAVVFQEASLNSIWRMGSSFRTRLTRRQIAAFIWMIMASIYLLSFPTWLSAMTGYNTNVVPYFQTTEGIKYSWSNITFPRAAYTIYDGDRIGLTSPYIVGDGGYWSDKAGPLDYDKCADYAYYSKSVSDLALRCQIAVYTSEYLARNDGGAPRDQESVFNTTSLTSPTLHIAVYNTTWLDRSGKAREGFFTKDTAPKTTNSNPLPVLYSIGNHVYNKTDIEKRSSCDDWRTYQWGFSFLLLFIFAVISTVWTIGMYSMWMDTYWNSRLDRSHRDMGFFRGVVDASNAMRKDMGENPTAEASESEIKAMVARGANGGHLSLEDLDQQRLPLNRSAELCEWIKDVPSLNGWTYPWTSLHWAWLVFFFLLAGILFVPVGAIPAFLCLLLLLVGLCSTLWRRIGKPYWERRYTTATCINS